MKEWPGFGIRVCIRFFPGPGLEKIIDPDPVCPGRLVSDQIRIPESALEKFDPSLSRNASF